MKKIFAAAFVLMLLVCGRSRLVPVQKETVDGPPLYLVMERLIPASEISDKSVGALIPLVPPPGPICLLPEENAVLSELLGLSVKI